MINQTQCPADIWQDETARMDRCYQWIDKTISEATYQVNQATRVVQAGSYEDQDAFIAHSERASALQKQYRNEKWLQEIQQRPYFGHYDITNNQHTMCFYFTKSEFLDELMKISDASYLIPFKQDENKPSINELIMRYRNRMTSPFYIQNEQFNVQKQCEVDIRHHVLHSVIPIFPEVCNVSYSSDTDEYLSKRLDENRTNPHLRNIIETIQKKQFDVIQTDAHTSFVVQGCAGSGKTQMILHRLFYLRGVLGRNGWSDVLLIAPTKLIFRFSADLIRRFRLDGTEQTSLAELYVALLCRYDNRFKSRQYKFMWTEEYLPDVYLQRVYDKENVSRVQQAIMQAIQARIREGCQVTKRDMPAQGVYASTVEDMIEKLTIEIDSLKAKENLLTGNAEYQMHRNAFEKISKQIVDGDKRSKQQGAELERLTQQQTEYLKLFKELSEANQESEIWEKARNESIQQLQAALYQKEKLLEAATCDRDCVYGIREYMRAQIEFDEAVSPHNAKARRDHEYSQLLRDICDECESTLKQFTGGISPKKWIDKNQLSIEKIKQQMQQTDTQLRNAGEELQKHSKWIDDWIQELGVGSDSDQLLDELPTFEHVRYTLSRLESGVFEQEVWNALTPLKEAHNVPQYEILEHTDGHKQQLRILYKADILFYLMIYYTMRGKDGLPQYRLICIDEGQDLHMVEYQLLHKLFPNATLNVFGDVEQVLHMNSGITSWQEETGIKQVFTMNENYRNAPAIAEFCNKHFNCKMISFGHSKHEVETVKRSDTERIRSILKHPNIIILIKTHEDYEYITENYVEKNRKCVYIDADTDTLEDGALMFYTVFAAKGLEFANVFVYASDMTLNQKIVACTRATSQLTYCE